MKSIYWCIGFVWGNGTLNINEVTGSRLIIRHKNIEPLQWIIDVIKPAKGTKPYLKSNTYCLGISTNNGFVTKILSLGWSGRMDKDRKYPIELADELEFIRGYCYTKATTDYSVKLNRMRMRIYGSYDIVKNIDMYIAKYLDDKQKTIQLQRNQTQDNYIGTTHYVAYQNRSKVISIAELLQKPLPK